MIHDQITRMPSFSVDAMDLGLESMGFWEMWITPGFIL